MLELICFKLETANMFSVEYHNWYKVVTNNVKNEKYALVCCGQSSASLTGFDAVINIPVTSVGVDRENTVLSYMELLNVTGSAVFITANSNVTSPCYSNVPNSLPLVDNVDIIIGNKASSSHPNSTRYVEFSPNADVLSPLQVTIYFKRLTLLHDAGGSIKYINSAQNAVGLNTLEFEHYIHEADYVIDNTPMETLGDSPYDKWVDLGMFKSSAYDETFLQDRTVFRWDGLVNKFGFDDWSERSIARPDLALTDAIHLLYPTYNPTYQFTWLRNFAKADTPRTVSDSDYPSCSDVRLMLSQTCSSNPMFKEIKEEKEPLKPKEKAGISVGVIVFFVLLVVASVFIFRHFRQKSQKHQFIKMSEL
ncbi:hypothetical protein J3Q64DRAFT_1637659 [Phycomyces blakesleeanus]|uniref:Uncharacterized protein n=1 Tax=Phycomyces blakesleeanus TaxID=4837 RepID=A0ABR3B2R1_PHYBL